MAAQQLSFIRKPVIYHYSLTSIYEECPTCKAINKASEYKQNQYTGTWYTEYYDSCQECGQLFDWDAEALERVAKYTAEYKRAMLDVPQGGAVEKLPNGHYREVTEQDILQRR